MRKLLSCCLALLIGFCTQNAWASSSSSSSSSSESGACNERTSKTTQNFLPYGRINLLPVFVCDNSAIGILGEIGPKNYRINGTYGLFYGDHHRIKVGGEYLGQKLHYRFLTGQERRWVQQYAAGGKYQYLFGCCSWLSDFFQGIQLSGYYSRAQSHTPRSILCLEQNFTVFRHIAGGRQWNAEGGLIIRPWACGTIIGTVGYDEFKFRKHFTNQNKYSGVSGTVYLNQRMWCQFALDVKAEFRRAYNYLEGMLSWNRRFLYGEATLGVFGSHTWGKSRLASVSTVGGELRFAFGVEKSSSRCDCGCCPAPACPSELAEWVASPAVYIPQVFAISESIVCLSPTSTPFPLIIDLGVAFDFPLGFSAVNLATNFTSPSGAPLVFTGVNLPPEVSLQSNGTLFVNNDGLNPGVFDISVTATSGCGSTTLIIPILLEGGA